jgi:diaminopimelate decarboxylase
VHAHLGTELGDPARYEELARVLVDFAREARAATGAPINEIGLGGGLRIPLRPDDPVLDLATYARAVTGPIRRERELAQATVYLEPGRWLVGRAGIVLYRVVGTKRVRGIRPFVAVDGGMGDNIRPALYGATYTAVVVDRAGDAPDEDVAVAGKYCEGGDILVPSVALASARRGDVLAIPAAGAYALAMASTYNAYPRPAAALIEGGRARLVRRRERYADLWRLDR